MAKTWTFEDRSDWPDFDLGWGNEPDKAEWRDPDTGYPCIARRGTSGAWCGYVGVGPESPFYEVHYGDCPKIACDEQAEKGYCCHTPEHILNAHGGITYSAPCRPGEDERYAICHVPEEGETDEVWWFGFDCAHAGDFTPGFWKIIHDTMGKIGDANQSVLLAAHEHDLYRTLNYVKLECAALAKQLAELSGSGPP